ncbi:NUDIX hydrolase [uncultured Pseudacidovorax sp.]|uniref:NUDIX hydrolase n=1 Tax=uncultured Pseudacidovorax sp. TaxID=679313 RepID=UPI0025CFDBC4|nr:NUDIX hydrolase [uncultured Pseudacidovorax sp.]
MTPPSTPPVLPIEAASSVLLLRDGPGGLEVFMVRRHDRSSVLGGAWVFPGGKVDLVDAHPEIAPDADPQALPFRLAEPDLPASVALALHMAALREVFEECGVLFAHGASGATPAAWVARVHALCDDGLRLDAAMAEAGLQPQLLSLHPFSRWITPERSVSFQGRRFDTRFFIAALPLGQTAEHDDHEAVASAWLSPREALQQYWDGRMALAPPQIMSLVHLAHASARGDLADLMEAVRERGPYCVRPHVMDLPDGGKAMAYPGDPAHDVPERAMPGPLRLFVKGPGRFEPEGGIDGFWA